MNLKLNLPLHWRLIILTVLIALPTFVLMYFVSAELRHEAAQRAQDDALELAHTVAREQNRMIEDTRILLTTIARWPQLQPDTWTDCQPFLADLMTQLSPAYRNIGVATLSGDVVCAVILGDKPLNIADRDFFQRAVATQQFATSDYLIGKLSKVPVMGFAAPIWGPNGEMLGAATSTVDLSWLRDAVDTAALPDGSVVTVFDQNGRVLARLPEAADAVGSTLPADHPLVRAILNAGGDGTLELPGFDGTPSLVAYTQLPGPQDVAPIFVSVAIPSEVAYAPVNAMLRRNLIWMGLTTVFMAILALLGGDLLIRGRVRQLVKATRQLATGDFGVRVGTPAVRDEVGDLEQTFNQMALSLQKLTEERSRAQLELQHRAEELARSNAELEQFAYVASHDLQEPLRIVSGYLGLLNRRYGSQFDQDGKEFIHYALDAAERMQTLIRDLLAYSRVSTRGQPPTPVAAEDALAAALANLQVAVSESGATITHDPLPRVMADMRQLIQLFQNLIGNAVKFRSQAPLQIQIAAERQDGFWRFAIQDNGIGIEPEYAERIFVLFQRLHTREEYPGTGIGLAICKKIVERHGGQIGVASTLGQGATFYFTLPAVEPDAPSGAVVKKEKVVHEASPAEPASAR